MVMKYAEEQCPRLGTALLGLGTALLGLGTALLGLGTALLGLGTAPLTVLLGLVLELGLGWVQL